MTPDPDHYPPTQVRRSDPLAGLDAREALAAGMQSISWEPPQPEELAAVLPEYQIYEIIGRGGMGVIYRARDIQLDRMVAIKLLPPELSSRADLVERFTREARALARLDHSNIVKVHDFSRTTRDHLYFVMEFVEGLDLSRILRARTEGTPPKDHQATLEIIGQICDALQYAHSKGIVHRDIKPANVLISKDGQVKVADFGLARATEPVDGGTSVKDSENMTISGMIMGTLEYMAPEQREGLRVDHRADIYAVGVLFYQMLTGHLPRGAFLPPSRRTAGVDARLDKVVLKALQTEPDERYQRASEVRDAVQALQRLKAPPPPRPRPPRPESPARGMALAGLSRLSGVLPRLRRRKPAALWGGGAILALCAAWGWHGWQGGGSGPPSGRFPASIKFQQALPGRLQVSDGIFVKSLPADGHLPLDGFYMPQSSALTLTCFAPGYQSQTIMIQPGGAPPSLKVLLEPGWAELSWQADPPGWFSATRVSRVNPPVDPRWKPEFDLPPRGGRVPAGIYTFSGNWGAAAVPLGSRTLTTGPQELAAKWPLPLTKTWTGMTNLNPRSILSGLTEPYRKEAAAWNISATIPFVVEFQPAGQAGLRVLNARILDLALLALLGGTLPTAQWQDEAAATTLFRDKIILPLSFQNTSPTRLGSWFAALWKEQSRTALANSGEEARTAIFTKNREQAEFLSGILLAADVPAWLNDPKYRNVSGAFFDHLPLTASSGSPDRLQLEAADAKVSLSMDWTGTTAAFISASGQTVPLKSR